MILRILIFRNFSIFITLSVDILIDSFLLSITYILEGSKTRINRLLGLFNLFMLLCSNYNLSLFLG